MIIVSAFDTRQPNPVSSSLFQYVANRKQMLQTFDGKKFYELNVNIVTTSRQEVEDIISILQILKECLPLNS